MDGAAITEEAAIRPIRAMVVEKRMAKILKSRGIRLGKRRTELMEDGQRKIWSGGEKERG